MADHFQILVPLQKGSYFAAQLQWEYFLVPKIEKKTKIHKATGNQGEVNYQLERTWMIEDIIDKIHAKNRG